MDENYGNFAKLPYQRKIQILPFTRIIENTDFLEEFLNNEGLKLLALNFVYLIQIPAEYSHNEKM